jgi:hypothetical protein
MKGEVIMKTSIRKGVFETNSSSTHSITICTKDQYKSFVNNELYIDIYREKLITQEELEGMFEKYNKEYEEKYGKTLYHNLQDFKDSEGIKTYEEWCSDDYLEKYHEEYITPRGEEIVVFGKYGYDG